MSADQSEASRVQDVRIRHARREDVPRLARLLDQLFESEHGFAADSSKHLAALELLLEERAAVLVADGADGRRVVGMTIVQGMVSTAEGGKVGFLGDTVVDAGFQGQGIGKKLLQAAEEWAWASGMKRLNLVADGDNVPVVSFYQSQGWSATNLVAVGKRAPVDRVIEG